MGEPILKVKHLKVGTIDGKTETPIVNGVSFELNTSETLGIVGESGCGKSMTSLSLMGLLPRGVEYLSGDIELKDLNLQNFKSKDWQAIRGKRLSMIFQEPMSSLNPVIKIKKQVRDMIQSHQNIPNSEADKVTLGMLEKVGIPRAEEVLDYYPHQLSGGMRQRVMIAMAMINAPEILVADEPTTALDVTIQAQILELMHELQHEMGMSIILITHDLGVVAEVCDRVVVMYAGEVIEEANTVTLFDDPLHPYTKGLLASLPSVNEEKEYLSSISGTVPSPKNMPTGCRFRERCTFAHDKCQSEVPMFINENGSQVRCWLHEGKVVK